MPELPEVETVCRTLAPVLIGRELATSEILWPRTLAHPDPGEFLRSIGGQTIIGVDRRGKLVLLRLESSATISVHLRMTGELLFRPAGAEPGDDARRTHLRAAFLFIDGSELLFYDTRKFGRISYLTPGQVEELDTALGIEPLSEAFTADWLAEALNQRKRQIKPLLLDQTFIAGLGNIYVDEALYIAGLHPLTRSDLVTGEQATGLRDAIVETLTGAINRRGTTLRDYRSGLGESGSNRPRLLIYGSKPGSPCGRCGAPLQRLVVGQRGSIFCPRCQPFISPPDTQCR